MADGPQAVCPGDRLSSADGFAAGQGTYEERGAIYACLAGTKRVVQPGAAGAADPQPHTPHVDEHKQKPTVEVFRSGAQAAVPVPGDIVTAKVTRVNQRFAAADILCIGSRPVAGSEGGFAGVVRLQDVRATEIDKILLGDCFRPGDVVRAEVVSLGDSRSYYLSTARNELGVVYARSVAGVPMVAVGWEEMQCPETKAVEKRKVAKTATAAPASA